MSGSSFPTRPAAAVAALLIVIFAGLPAAAAGTPTAMSIGAPTTVELGQTVTLQARLADSTGAPIAKATVVFVMPATFLSASGDVVVASATTDKAGLVAAEWPIRGGGTLTVRAEFRGDTQYAPSQAAAQIVVTGSQQLYSSQAGVRLPGLNAGPAIFGQVLGTSRFWAVLTGWPIGLILLTVWSLYGIVVSLIFRVAAAAAPRNSAGQREESEAGQ
jgi:Bacterial Ig-like domain (group 3)